MEKNVLELTCMNCGEKINLRLNPKELRYYQETGSLIEGSDAYHDLFGRFGWVLRQMPFCDICKYEHSEVYQEDTS